MSSLASRNRQPNSRIGADNRGNGGRSSSSNRPDRTRSRGRRLCPSHRTFSCPFLEEGNCLHQHNPERCRFGHPTTVADLTTLRQLPYYVCIHFLNGRCQSITTIQIRNSNIQGCHSGLHLKLQKFGDNPEQFEQQNRELLIQFFGTDIELECSICFEKVLGKRFARNRLFGILENCDHVFCNGCLSAWRQNSTSCPNCRVVSPRYVVRNKFVQTSAEKSRLFPETAGYTTRQSTVNYSQNVSSNNVFRTSTYRPNIEINRENPYRDYYYESLRSSYSYSAPNNGLGSLSLLALLFTIGFFVAVYFIWRSLKSYAPVIWLSICILVAAYFIWKSLSWLFKLFKIIGFFVAVYFIWRSLLWNYTPPTVN